VFVVLFICVCTQCWHQVYHLDLLCLVVALLLLSMLAVRCAALMLVALVHTMRQSSANKGAEETVTDVSGGDGSTDSARWWEVRSLTHAAHSLWRAATGGGSGTVHSSASPHSTHAKDGDKQVNGHHRASFPASASDGDAAADAARFRSSSMDSADGRARAASIDTASDDDDDEHGEGK